MGFLMWEINFSVHWNKHFTQKLLINFPNDYKETAINTLNNDILERLKRYFLVKHAPRIFVLFTTSKNIYFTVYNLGDYINFFATWADFVPNRVTALKVNRNLHQIQEITP